RVSSGQRSCPSLAKRASTFCLASSFAGSPSWPRSMSSPPRRANDRRARPPTNRSPFPHDRADLFGEPFEVHLLVSGADGDAEAARPLGHGGGPHRKHAKSL